ncbi:MAG: flagellar basal body P-ring protein FlgI [Phycisphaerales bacterium]|nr:flagellar basal body P-ring protein FlgI [Phycisphaerales bacterium]
MTRKAITPFAALLSMLIVLVGATPAHGVTLQELARLEGQGESTVWGLGLVVGLNGTGDSGSVLPLARQVAALMEAGGNAIPDIEELAKSKNMALVMVTANLDAVGSRRGDKVKCRVQAYHSAKSLAGGQLFITPLRGPTRNDNAVYAYAQGPLVVDPNNPTSATLRDGTGSGAQLVHDIFMPVIGEDWTVSLIIKRPYAGWPTTRLVAGMINQYRQGFAEDARNIARALDERTVIVQIPLEERANWANFMGQLMGSIEIDISLLQLPAQIIINERTGSIVMTGDVEISSALIAHKDMVITEITPPVVPTAARPEVDQSSWTGIIRETSDRRKARIDDLLNAMRQLDVSVEDQIGILTMLHEAGQLHAELVIE